MDHLFRTEYGKMVSFLASTFGFDQLETAEDIAQETIAHAFSHWSFNGVPNNPQAWLFKVAKNKALNHLKREKTGREVYKAHSYLNEDRFEMSADEFDQEIQDSMLRMIFACCHPAIAVENQIALILKSLCGFSRKEIAHALLTNEEVVKKRLFRAKKEIKEKGIELIPPTGPELTQRLAPVCSALYLLFNEGYNSTHSEELIRKDLCLEAMRLTKLLVQQGSDDSRPTALLALMCFHVARFESRLDDNGAIILFQDQDRSLWNRELIRAGMWYLTESSKGNRLSGYHLEASIAAQHCLADSYEDTKWPTIHHFYSKLYEVKKNPIILLNLAIVSSKIEGVEKAIHALEDLKSSSKALAKYYLLYASLGELYREAGKKEDALTNLKKAIDLTSSEQEITLLENKIKDIEAP